MRIMVKKSHEKTVKYFKSATSRRTAPIYCQSRALHPTWLAQGSALGKNTEIVFPSLSGDLLSFEKVFNSEIQMKLAYIIEELISPVVTPFILIFKLRYRAPELIDFFRSNTIDVQGMFCTFSIVWMSEFQSSIQRENFSLIALFSPVKLIRIR